MKSTKHILNEKVSEIIGSKCEVCGHRFKPEDEHIQVNGPSYVEIITTCPKCKTQYYD